MKSKPKIILIGGRGHCKAVIDVIENENKYEIAGIVDLSKKLGEKILNYSIIANDNELDSLIKKYAHFFITVGHIKNADLRIKLFNKIINLRAGIPVIISKNAYISNHSIIMEGTIIMHNALINADTFIGKNCIINSKALVEHDCTIRNNCHISTNATVNGGCVIGDECFIGSNSVIKQYTKIAKQTIIGAGAVVTKDITEKGIYVGNPAKKIK